MKEMMLCLRLWCESLIDCKMKTWPILTSSLSLYRSNSGRNPQLVFCWQSASGCRETFWQMCSCEGRADVPAGQWHADCPQQQGISKQLNTYIVSLMAPLSTPHMQLNIYGFWILWVIFVWLILSTVVRQWHPQRICIVCALFLSICIFNICPRA